MQPPRPRRWPWVAGLAGLAVVIVAVGLLTGRSDQADPAAGDGAGAAPTTTVVTTAPDQNQTEGQGTGAGSAGEETLRWEQTGAVRLPVSATHGPREQTGGLASGFSRTELGAVLAAVHLDYRISALAGPQVYQPTITEQTVGDTATTLAEVEANYTQRIAEAGARYGEPLLLPPEQVVAVRGYQFTGDPAGDRVVVRVCAQQGQAASYLADHTMVWADGDWRLEVPIPDPQPVSDLSGCTPLPGA